MSAMPSSESEQIGRYYDAVPYVSHPFPQTDIEHLEVLAALFALEAAVPARARVLELGCASGGNLVPMAARHPQAQMLGVDLSALQIQDGQALLARVHVPNAQLRTLSITDIDASLGQFDYILCHGVYSWVPPEVQAAILRVCRQNLAPEGVAYVSYNVYPGWKAREIVRDAMMLRGGPRDTPEEKLAYARGMLEFLEQSARPDSVLKKTLDEAMPIVRSASNSYLLHEFLEPCNAPCYFKEFVARAGEHELAYLCDAEPSTMFVQNYGEKVREPLLRECGGSQVMLEQYLDFLVNRTFRQSLLVHQARQPQIRYRLERTRLRALHYAGMFAAPDGSPITLDAQEQPCVGLRNHSLTLRLPVHKAVAMELEQRYPATVDVDTLVAAVSARVGEPQASVHDPVMAMLEELLILGAVRVRCQPLLVAPDVSSAPLVSHLVRQAPGLDLADGAEASVCNQWHELVALTALERTLLPLLDGAHDAQQLSAHVLAEVRAGRLRFMKDDQAVTDAALQEVLAQEQLQPALRQLRRKGLLIA
ncbi:class I SAM-dependent methyltransferase [Xenophilus arseniciresistens]|uniref:Class I SAM-dependent methyltransferase n=1 Tax=Xenophilus arseniciresistens TaxID=1283306 RepID=A0AAE3N8L2_9BURK|nr:class I SAM-dependent methyltransferase [Xenophilus arseniciresistens]MDA7416574.1 class I SAM-dependent methyltransferase [Xenophilus arseniciresistens]